MANGLDGEQIAWRREKLESLRHNFAEKYPEDEVTCFIVSGSMFFDKETLMQRYKELQTYEPFQRFNKFLRFKKPIKHRSYIIGADPAQGLPITSENPDYSAAVVIDQETGEEMAAYRAHVLPHDFARDLVEMAEEYNSAHVAVEHLFEGGTVIQAITNEMGYWNIYRHRDWWKRDWKNAKEKDGFPTNARNRPMALNRIRDFLSTCPHLVYDKLFIGEAMTFEKGKPEATPGSHDDTVMCRGIAYYVRAVRNGWLNPENIRKRERYGDTPIEFQEPEYKM
jgi:hypothetical protein